MLLEHPDHGMKIFGQRISRTENVEFFLHEQSGLVAHRFFDIADIYNPACKGNFFDSGAERLRQSDGFNHNIGTLAAGEVRQPLMQRFMTGMDGMGGARPSAVTRPRATAWNPTVKGSTRHNSLSVSFAG